MQFAVPKFRDWNFLHRDKVGLRKTSLLPPMLPNFIETQNGFGWKGSLKVI